MDNKERLIQEAKTLFMRLGIRSVSMDDIASHLGMSKKTIYQLFTDKDELVDNIIDADTNKLQSDCVTCCQLSANAIDEIFRTMEMIGLQLRKMNPMLLFDLQKYHYRSYEKFMRYRNSFLLEIITTNLVKGIKEELYRSDIKIEILSRFRLESMMLAFNQETFPSDRFNMLEVTLEIIEHFLYGLATEKGYKLINEYKKKANNNGI